MVEEYGVHSLPYPIVAPECKGEVAEPAADLCPGKIALYPGCGIYEIQSIGIVFVHTGGYSQHIRVEDYVFRIEIQPLNQQAIGPFADFDTSVKGVGLSLLVKCHNYQCSTEFLNLGRPLQENLLPFLEREGVHYGLALQTLESRFQHLEAGGVHHHRHTGNLRVGGHKAQEMFHLSPGIEHSVVHIHVQHHSPVTHLCRCNFQGLAPILFLDKTQEFPASRHIAPFSHIYEHTPVPESVNA